MHDAVARVFRTGAVFNIGQLTDAEVRALNKAAKAGEVVKVRGYWPNVFFGLGPKKTIWLVPDHPWAATLRN